MLRRVVIPFRPSDRAEKREEGVRVNVRKARPCALRSFPVLKVLKAGSGPWSEPFWQFRP